MTYEVLDVGVQVVAVVRAAVKAAVRVFIEGNPT